MPVPSKVPSMLLFRCFSDFRCLSKETLDAFQDFRCRSKSCLCKRYLCKHHRKLEGIIEVQTAVMTSLASELSTAWSTHPGLVSRLISNVSESLLRSSDKKAHCPKGSYLGEATQKKLKRRITLEESTPKNLKKLNLNRS